MTAVKLATLGLGLLAIAMLATPAQADNYGVIFSGGVKAEKNYDRYYEETLRMWNIMTGTLGYDMDKVYVLFADGTDADEDLRLLSTNTYVSSDWSDIVNAGGIIRDARPGTLQTTLEEIDVAFQDEVDCFHFWSFDHGGNTNPPDIDNGVLSGWGGSITDDQFATWVAPIDGYAESYALGQCYAGSMVNDLEALPDQDNRFYAWAADWYESSYGRGWVDVWADGIEAGMRGTWELGDYAMYNDPFRPGAHPTYTEHPGWIGDNFHLVTNQPIPEPSTLALLGVGAIALVWVRRRRR